MFRVLHSVFCFFLRNLSPSRSQLIKQKYFCKEKKYKGMSTEIISGISNFKKNISEEL